MSNSTVFELPLPSGVVVSFRMPKYRDRQIATKRWKLNQSDVGYALEELLAFSMLLTINGVPVLPNEQMDIIAQVDDWDLKDLSYYMEVFFAMAFTDDTQKQRAQEQARALLEGKSLVKTVASPTTSAPITAITA